MRLSPLGGKKRGVDANLSAVAVVDTNVGASRERAGDTVAGSKRLDAAGNSSRGVEILKGLEVDSKTSNVGAGHGGSAVSSCDGVGSDAGREDINTRGKDIDTRAVVGEVGSLPGGVVGSDSQGVGDVGGRLGGNGERVVVLITVSGSNNSQDALVVGSVDSLSPEWLRGTAERQVDDGASGTSLADDVVDSPVETVEDDGGAGGAASKDLDRDQVGLSQTYTS